MRAAPILCAFLLTTMAASSSTKAYSHKATELDPALYPSPPEGLTLEQVNVFVRHGERTPVGVRLQDPPASLPAVWRFCGPARRFKATVDSLGKSDIHRVVERVDGKAEDDGCMLGELTNVGRQSAYQYGKALRALYVTKLRFLPHILDSQSTVYLRSTNVPRTIETLQEILHGLYPIERTSNGLVPRIHMRQPQDEDLTGNGNVCARLKELMLRFETAAKEKYNPKLALLDDAMSPYLGGVPVRIDGKPRASGILDTIRAAISHNVTVPPVFMEPKVMQLLEEAVVAEWYDSYRDPEVRKLGMGRLLGSISARMQNKVDKGDQDPLKIAIHACHDSSLADLCQTLDVFDGRWPEFTASVTMELFKDKAVRPSTIAGFLGFGGPAHYVRMRYQNRTLRLPFCANSGNHYPGEPGICTLEAFNRHVARFIPKDWAAECRPTQSAKYRSKEL